jgi:hypothetical protein
VPELPRHELLRPLFDLRLRLHLAESYTSPPQSYKQTMRRRIRLKEAAIARGFLIFENST